ncbi:hypothetical protein L218DRAFT_1065376 [Marasmius fiardii PR-910]|nr:hypothetical protein L218DRAFT_952038 [Marasmius fiardii PR-910]KAF9251446.1 hypothetical protein L218DRAFT_1065376 [Marasmius fiardii PR-910]
MQYKSAPLSSLFLLHFRTIFPSYSIPRPRIYHTKDEKKKAQARNSLKWNHKNREKVNARRRKTIPLKNIDQSTNATSKRSGPDEGGLREEGGLESRMNALHLNDGRPSNNPENTNREDSPKPSSTLYTYWIPYDLLSFRIIRAVDNETQEEYWIAKIAKIEQEYRKVGVGESSDYEYAQAGYLAAVDTSNDTLAYYVLDGLHTQLGNLVSSTYKVQSEIMNSVGSCGRSLK